jgi:Outer membrane protein transport protein (OMPP1/FadL/TodX)
LGGVYVFENEDTSSKWKKFAVAVNYDNMKSFDNSIFVAGTNPNSSIANYFISYANGLNLDIVNGSAFPFDQLYYNEQQANLGYTAFIINEAPGYNDTNYRNYVSLVAPGGNYYQENSIITTGYNGKLTANISAIYDDKLLVGVNLNAHFSDYRKSTSFYESNTNNTTTDNLVKRLRFNNDLASFGNGYSFQIGAIYKPTKQVRLGLAIDSPTWYEINDELTQRVYAVSGSINGELPPDQANNPYPITMVYEPYQLITPGKLTGSFAYIFGKKGLISFDYTVKDYGSTKFTPKKDYIDENKEISDLLVVANEFKVGAEYKIRQFSLRGGYRFEESPYKNGKTIGNLMGYSTGIGYNFGKIKLDAAYSFSQRDTQQAFFTQGFTEAPKITTKTNNVSVSLVFEL